MSSAITEAASVAKFVELQAVNLTAASLDTTFDPLHPPAALEISTKYKSSYTRVEESGQLRVLIEFDFGGTSPESEQPASVRLKATMQLIYRLPGDAEADDEALDAFARLNGAYNAWPYWRELVQTVSGRVGLAGIIVPVFRAREAEAHFSGRIDQTSPVADPEA